MSTETSGLAQQRHSFTSPSLIHQLGSVILDLRDDVNALVSCNTLTLPSRHSYSFTTQCPTSYLPICHTPTSKDHTFRTVINPSNQPVNLAKMQFVALFTNLTFYHLSLSVVQVPDPRPSPPKANPLDLTYLDRSPSLTFVLGAQIYQSFIANITASNALTRAQFRILQAAIWPMYFKLQMVVSILLALTYPGGDRSAALFHGSASMRGLVDGGDYLTRLLPLSLMFLFSATNVLWVAPMTIKTMWKLHVGMLKIWPCCRCMRTPSAC